MLKTEDSQTFYVGIKFDVNVNKDITEYRKRIQSGVLDFL